MSFAHPPTRPPSPCPLNVNNPPAHLSTAAAVLLPLPQDTKAAKEVKALQDFMTMLGSDPARAFYGPGHVRAAHELGAVQVGGRGAGERGESGWLVGWAGGRVGGWVQ